MKTPRITSAILTGAFLALTATGIAAARIQVPVYVGAQVASANHHHLKPGDAWFKGGWCLERREHHRKHEFCAWANYANQPLPNILTETVDKMWGFWHIVFVGRVHHNWPFSHFWLTHHGQWTNDKVVLLELAPDGDPNQACVEDAPLSANQDAVLGACSEAKQDGRDKYFSYFVWHPLPHGGAELLAVHDMNTDGHRHLEWVISATHLGLGAHVKFLTPFPKTEESWRWYTRLIGLGVPT